MSLVSSKLRASAKGQPCTFQIPQVCCRNPETTVLCHAPSEIKGMGNKGDDHFAAFGCFECHTALDQYRVTDRDFYWLRGVRRTQKIWVELGLMQFPETSPKAKPSSKILPRRHIMSGKPIALWGKHGALGAAGMNEETD